MPHLRGFLLIALLACLAGCDSRAPQQQAGTVSERSDTEVTPAASPATAPSVLGAAPQVIVFGVDGADPEILDYLLGKGLLPTFRQLIDEGASGPLRTIEPIFSPMIWTTIATGRMPEDHGILGFTVVDTTVSWLRPTGTGNRRVPALWNLASDMGITCTVSGWPVSWPAEEINGQVISNYFFLPQASADFGQLLDPETKALWPPQIAEEVAPLLVPPSEVTARTLARLRLGGIASNPVNLGTFAKDETFFNAAAHFLRSANPDLLMVYLQGIDVLGHTGYPAYEYYLMRSEGTPTPYRFKPGSLEAYVDEMGAQPALSPEEQQKLLDLGEATVRAYEYADRRLGELLAIETDRPRFVMVLSDHGFGRAPEGTLVKTGDESYTNPVAWHHNEGIVILHGAGVRPGIRLQGARVQDIFPTLAAMLRMPLAENLAGGVLDEALEPAIVEAAKTNTLPEYPDSGAASAPRPAGGGDALIEELRSLGYIR